MKVQSILASVIRIYNLEIRNGSKSKVIKEDSIHVYIHIYTYTHTYIYNGIQEGEANVLFVVYFFPEF